MQAGDEARTHRRLTAVGCAVICSILGFCGSAPGSILNRVTWQQPILVDPPRASHTLSFTNLSCPSTQLCVASDTSGNVLTSTAPASRARPWSVAHVDD